MVDFDLLHGATPLVSVTMFEMDLNIHLSHYKFIKSSFPMKIISVAPLQRTLASINREKKTSPSGIETHHHLVHACILPPSHNRSP